MNTAPPAKTLKATSSNWESTAPFEKTGLLTHPGETAAEILMRAHKREPDAMFLAATGYTWGICGFPKDGFLASAWIMQLGISGNVSAGSHVSVQTWMAEQLYTDVNLGIVLADCEAARESAYTKILQDTGYVDLNGLCARAGEFKPMFPDWEEKRLFKLNMAEKIKNLTLATMTLMRELRSRPATRQEQEKIVACAEELSTDILLFFAATTHNPEKDVPDWSAEKLLAFLEAQRTQLEKERQSGQGEMLPQFADLIREAGNIFARHTEGTSDNIPALIRKAHFGDISSIYTLAEHYANGTSGFVKFQHLSDFWLQHAALCTDDKAALALAVRFFSQGRLSHAWAWASIVSEYNDTDKTLKATAQTLAAKVEAIQGEKLTTERKHLKKRFADATVKMVEWRYGINKE